MKYIWEKIKKMLYNNYELIRSGIVYVSCIIFVEIIAKKIIEYPVAIAYKYNIELTGEEYVNLYVNYKYIFIATLIIAICAIPFVKLVNRLKKISKDGGEFYPDEKQNTSSIINLSTNEVSNEIVQNLLTSDDDNLCDEKKEEILYTTLMNEQENQSNLLKCKNIKSHINSLTQLVMMELFKHNKDNITLDLTIEYVKKVGNHKKKKMEDRNKEIAKNIIAFLKNNDIIESDDIEEGKYYFTLFGRTYMNYFSSGII